MSPEPPSHVPPSPVPPSPVPPIRREILVDADPATAFEVFTGRLGRWWPLAELSVYGADATVAFDEGQIIERATDGRAAVAGCTRPATWSPRVRCLMRRARA